MPRLVSSIKPLFHSVKLGILYLVDFGYRVSQMVDVLVIEAIKRGIRAYK
jgi:hypothetical protein